MSFNTQHCRNFIEDGIDFDIMADAIKTAGAEIVGLNEMYGEGERPQFRNQVGILSQMTQLGYYYFAKAIDVGEGSNPYGNGLISKFPIEKAETVAVPDPCGKEGAYGYETRCLLKARLTNGLNVLVIHFGLNHDEQTNAVKTVIENLPSEKTILMGDFNVTPDDEVLSPLRERLKDTAELFKGERLSYPSDKPEKKIDYIFVSSDIEVVSADIPPIVASDHRPHIAEINI